MSALAEIRRIADRDGVVSPETLLDEARPANSPLHRYFTWDDTAAAEKYRLHEASQLIRRYTVEIQTEPEKVIRPRAFVNVGPREYAPIEEAMNDPSMRDVVLASAIRELSALRRKYEHLCDFDAAVQASQAKRRPQKRSA